MKHLTLIALLGGLCAGAALAETQPVYDPGSGAYSIRQAGAEAAGPSAHERARAAVAAGQDLNAVMEPTAAGPRPVHLPYLDGGHYGGRSPDDC